MTALPLLFGHPAAPFAHSAAGTITRGEFLADVVQFAATLPPHRYAVNLCDNRYLFTVAFAAVLLRGQTNLLPPNHTPQLVNEIPRT